MSPTSVIGPLFDSGELEAAALATLQARLPAYLSEIRSQKDFGAIAPIKSWGVVSEFNRFPEQGLPALIIMCPGTVGETSKDGSGYFSGIWSLAVAVEVAASTGAAARRVAQLYGAAVRGALGQRRSLGEDFVVDWVREGLETIDIGQRRTRVASEQIFTVQADEVYNWRGGLPTEDTDYTHPDPDDAPDDPPAAWPTVETHDTDVQHKEPEE